ncbi:hypothetical protein GVN21_06015 [Caulobacter sp. SLTY]|uniref:Ig-like domain-containing protein n=1 Tax=Caulobacter sp. SLTY TaxID=2683262 RepID=UPI0014121DAE|nr:Ig-like domain-containing protein [Caulobacter sp. SLTY]NBB14918.1 hypothetical protein [Caulobacter sp. SLTY]
MADVGYYDMQIGAGNANQLDEIVEVGETGVNVTSLTATTLQPLRVLLVQNPDNGGYDAGLLAAWPDVLAAVNNGLVVVIHDRYVTDAANLMPAGTSISFTREFSVAMQLGTDGSEIASTPFGTVTDTSLDNGGFSNHGYALLSSLPAGSQVLMTTDDPTHVTAFVVFHGAGAIIYSSVPLDFGGYNNSNPGSDNVWEDFGVNILAHALTLGQAQPPLNTAPVATDDTATINEGTPAIINVLANDTDAESDPLRITHIDGMAVRPGQVVTLASGSTVQLTVAGTLVYISGPTVNQLNLGQTGTETFSYTIADAVTGGLTDEGSVTVTVNGRYTIIKGYTNGADVLNGTAFDDEMNGKGGNDRLYGGAGNDILDGGGGGQLDVDIMSGGSGDDTYIVDSTRDQVSENTGDGIDTVRSSVSYTLSAAVENLVLLGTAVEGIGNATDNEITGNGVNNTLTGMAGHDSIFGGGGADAIYGGNGGDDLMGGSGADVFVYKAHGESQATVTVPSLPGGAQGAPVRGPGVNTDIIYDFSVAEQDKIDLKLIDAQTSKAGDQDFTIVDAFTGVQGQMTIKTYGLLSIRSEDGGPVAAPSSYGYIIEADINGDRVSDFTLLLNSQAALTVSQLGSAFIGVAAVNITSIGAHASAPAAMQTTIPEFF